MPNQRGLFRADHRLATFVGIGSLVGLAMAMLSLDFAFFFGDPPLVRGLGADAGSSFAGFRFFVQDDWHFPLLATDSLVDGTRPETVIAMTDSLPLLALVAKALRFLGLSAEHWIAGWYYGCFVMQGVGAALVAYTHEVRSRWSVVAMAVLASTAPVLMLRIWHPGLFGQFTVLLMWAAVGMLWHRRTLRSALWLVPALVVALLVHPYFFVMCSVIGVGAIVSAWFERVLDWKQTISWFALTAATLLVAMYGFGYIPNRAVAPGGYGEYGMYLVGPFWPQWSRLWPGNEWLLLNRTGTFEGVNYLGAGGVLAVALAIVLQPRRVWRFAVRRQVFVLVLATLTAVAVTHAIYVRTNLPYLPLGEQMNELRSGTNRYVLGAAILALTTTAALLAWWWTALRTVRPVLSAAALMAWGYAASLLVRPGYVWSTLEQFRASGRFFWIIGYGLSLGGVVVIDRWLAERRPAAIVDRRRSVAVSVAAAAILLTVSGVQYFDTTQFRAFVPTMFNSTPDRVSHIDLLTALAGAHQTVHLGPDWFCTTGAESLLMFQDVVIAASFANSPVDAYYGGRTDVNVACDAEFAPPTTAHPLIVAAHPLDQSLPAWLPAGYECRTTPGALLCSDEWGSMPPHMLAAYPLFDGP